MKIVFVDQGPVEYNGEFLNSSVLGGTESSIIYLSEELAKKNLQVCVICKTKAIVNHNGVRYLPREDFYLNKDWWGQYNPDLIVCINSFSHADLWKQWVPSSKIFAWMHLAGNQPATKDLGAKEKVKNIDKIVGVSNWHANNLKSYYGNEKITYIKNAISRSFLNLFQSPEELRACKDKASACYTSVAERGLDILARSVPYLNKKIKFSIYSSYSDDYFTQVFNYLNKLEEVQVNKPVTHTDLAAKLKTTAFFTYPCNFEETYCISMVEAMAAGCKPIITDVGALKSIAGKRARTISINELNEEFFSEYAAVIMNEYLNYKNNPIQWSEEQYEQVKYINNYDKWSDRVNDWLTLYNMLT